MSKRRRARWSRVAVGAVALSLAVWGMYGLGWLGGSDSVPTDAPLAIAEGSDNIEESVASPASSATDEPVTPNHRSPVLLAGVEKARDAEQPASRSGSDSSDAGKSGSPAGSSGMQFAESGRRAAAAGDLLGARESYGRALLSGLSESEAARVRSEAASIADRTLFSDAALEGDPHVDMYIIQPGDTMGKLAKEWDVTAGLLASINNIADVNRIRAGQRIKVIRGPFRATVSRSAHRLDVWLGDVFVRSFPVALGSSGSTPIGEWRVKEKLEDPTYYPPRGGSIIRADDPQNPLGERWIGLEGISGEAVGQMRYGIHGTIEPESIGQDVSLGCVRMHNEDVQFLYDLLVVGDSAVIIGQ